MSYLTNNSNFDDARSEEELRQAADAEGATRLLTGVPPVYPPEIPMATRATSMGTSVDMNRSSESRSRPPPNLIPPIDILEQAQSVQSMSISTIESPPRQENIPTQQPQPAQTVTRQQQQPTPVHTNVHSTILSTRNPRTALKEYYDECEPQVPFSKKHFVVFIDNTNGDHVPLFTAFHVSFQTGEIFPSGQMDGACPKRRNGFWWYKKSDKAQFAAAGFALDCFHFRKNDGAAETFCNDPLPYEATNELTLEMLEARGVPPTERNKIQVLQDMARK